MATVNSGTNRGGDVEDISLLDYAEDTMFLYGTHTLEDQAVADYRDGLKPVQRRIIFAMWKLGLTHKSGLSKASRVVGETMGKYHPHGDSAIFGAAVTLANLPTPVIDGSESNWGSINEKAGAMRYIEARFTRYGYEALLNHSYFRITPHVRTYDGKAEEPLVLPAALPNILVNGTFGIAVAGSAHIPPFKIGGIKKLLVETLEGNPPTPKRCAEILRFNYPYGGIPQVAGRRSNDILKFMESGKGGVSFKSKFTENKKQRLLRVVGFAPRLNLNNALLKVANKSYVDHIGDITSLENGLGWEIFLKKRMVTVKNFQSYANKIKRMFNTRLSYQVNINERIISEDGTVSAEFESSTVPDIIERWVRWRKRIEKDRAKSQVKTHTTELWEVRARLLALDNLTTIMVSLSKEDSEAYLVRKLGTTRRVASFILNMQIRKLKTLHEEELEGKEEDLLNKLEHLLQIIKNPTQELLNQLSKVRY